MKTPHTERTPETPLTQDVIHAVRYWLHGLGQRIGGRRGLIAATVLVIGLGLAFNWGWLVAVGLAPILIAVLPCVAMCGIGLCCMGKGAGGSRAGTKDTDVASTQQIPPTVGMAANADPRFDGSDGSHPLDDTTITNVDPAAASDEPPTPNERN